jgi:spermidine synthase
MDAPTSGTGDMSGRAGRLPDVALLALVLAFFLVSGACALLYEVVWTRKLVLLFGTTAYAVSTVLAVYFAGMGIGSFLGGRLADRTNRPLLFYAIFELAIGVYALLFLLLLRAGESLLVTLVSALSISRGVGIALRGGLSFVLLVLPVSLMGATLPLLSRAVASEQKVLGLRIGSLYTVNTFGAVLGCFLAGFLLLPRFGFSGTTLIGATASLAVGLGAIALARASGGAPSGRRPVRVDDPGSISAAAGTPYSERIAGLVTVAFAVSGFCALALEVLWFRTLTIVFLGTTYAFTTMLTTFLCGIALGSMYASSMVDRRRHLVSLFGTVEALIGVSCILMLTVYTWLPPILDFFKKNYNYQWDNLIAAKFALAFAVLFVPTFLFGMTFPIVVKIVAGGRPELGWRVGRLYGANTFGGVAGSLVAGFVLIGVLGTHRGIELVSSVIFGVGILLILVCPTRRLIGRGVLAVAVTLLLALSLQTRPADMARTLNMSFLPENESMILYREGVEGTVVISEPVGHASGSDRTLWINASPACASVHKGVKLYRMEGILPMLFDRHPKTVLYICYGTGVTAGTLSQFDTIERIDAVEISPDVVENSHLFATDNLDVANDPRLNVTVDDGRNFLLTTDNRYDIITFSPMPLALSGVSTFYTREYYRLCLDHLEPGGIVSQWIPLHSLNPGIVRSLVRTFYESFPECCMWFINADVFMIGSDRPLQVDYSLLEQRIAPQTVQQELARVELGDIEELLVCFFMSKDKVDAYSRGASIMTDDRPWAEFAAPKEVYASTVDVSLGEMMQFYENPKAILAFRDMPDASVQQATERLDRRYRAHIKDLEGEIAYYGAGAAMGDPAARFKEALVIDPNDLTAPFYIREIALAQAGYYLRAGRVAKAVDVLTDAIRYAPNQTVLYAELGDIYHRRLEQDDKALEYYEAYLKAGGHSERIAKLCETIRTSLNESPPSGRE